MFAPSIAFDRNSVLSAVVIVLDQVLAAPRKNKMTPRTAAEKKNTTNHSALYL
jgi:hypothetical protein